MRVCMFCGDQASTKEDAWPPKWLTKRFPAFELVHVEAKRGSTSLRGWRTASPNIRVGCVCASCNNGWMSRLETAAGQMLEPLFTEQQHTIDAASLPTLAAWAVKTSMVLESLSPEDQARFYSDSERRQLSLDSTVPRRTYVWLAACVEQETVVTEARHLFGGHRSPGFRGFVATLAFGFLAIQVLTLRVPASVQPSTYFTFQQREGSWEEVLVPVWPVRGNLNWPPRQGVLGESGLEVLIGRFTEEAA
jgi:hypothetical protein